MAVERRPCCCMTTRTGCLIVGWLDVVFLSTSLMLTILRLMPNIIAYTQSANAEKLSAEFKSFDLDRMNGTFDGRLTEIVDMGAATIVMLLFGLPPPISLLYGTEKGRKSFLIPYIIFNILGHIGLFVMVLQYCMSLQYSLFILAAFAYQSSKLVVVWSHYLNLNDKERDGKYGLLTECEKV